MNVAELKKVLGDYPDDMMVCVEGHVDGYNELSNTAKVAVVFNVSKENWRGSHECISQFSPGPLDETGDVLSLS